MYALEFDVYLNKMIMQPLIAYKEEENWPTAMVLFGNNLNKKLSLVSHVKVTKLYPEQHQDIQN